jgi:hypothetical protein
MPAGRPLKFPDVEALQLSIDAYFASCHEPESKKFLRPYTVTGLALALDTSRETLCEYSERPEFVDTVKRAKLRCENFAEEQLFTAKNAAGPIFALKNYGWRDRQEIDQADVGDGLKELAAAIRDSPHE